MKNIDLAKPKSKVSHLNKLGKYLSLQSNGKLLPGQWPTSKNL